jgi:Rod binding domain-containing protein
MVAAPAPIAGVPASPAVPKELREAAEEFEAVFLAQLLQTMTRGLAGDGPLGDGAADPFRNLLNQEVARSISRAGGIGVADAVLQEMLKLQEVS